ncbi:hypothetical protein ACTXM8_10170 [Brachybacterium alimentarium]|uniref:hypothetical protein n=1 Tax=Brachybacterium alimentarium TaxID=47845 RepID=UPI003FD5E882
MSEYIVIHGEHSGDWCLVFDQLRETDAVRPILFRPRDWSAYPSQGLAYYPQSAIDLSRNARRAHRQAHRIVAGVEREHRRRIRRAARQRATIAQIKEETP